MKKEITVSGYECRIFEAGTPKVIMIQPVDEHDEAGLENEVSYITEHGGKDFALVAFKTSHWNDELSPWEAEPVFGKNGFAGGGGQTLDFVTGELVPFIREELKPEAGIDQKIIIGGYSLAGLFALWSCYHTDIFDGVVAASPSVWFPGWMDHIGTEQIYATNVYLSLGDKEEKTKNKVISKVGDNIREMNRILEEDPSVKDHILEWNAGNHFKEADIRTAKAFVWLLEREE